MKAQKIISILVVVCLIAGIFLFFCVRNIFFKPQETTQPKIAIVIDDWGYNLRYLNLLRAIDVPVTISILPNLRYSSKIAKIAKAQGQEVILHLPLQPESQGRELGLEEETITSDMSKDEIARNLEFALASVPYACGVSNHMGSRLTQEIEPMSVIFSELKKRRLFYLDNLVTDKSICQGLARKTGLKFIARDFFLDNLDDYEYIRGQFIKLCKFAQDTGQAVGIGHARLKTLEVLKDEIGAIQNKGIKFIFVSDLAE